MPDNHIPGHLPHPTSRPTADPTAPPPTRTAPRVPRRGAHRANPGPQSGRRVPTHWRRGVLPVGGALAAALVLGVGACTALEDKVGLAGDSPSTTASAPARRALTALTLGPVPAWDPQRIGTREDMAFATRVFARTLTAFDSGLTVRDLATLRADLATTTGTHDKTLKTWTFTLRDDARWQDGSPVTCADVSYGISRTFATSVIRGGPNYAITYLDVPKRPNGTSTYAGPYDTSAANRAGAKAFARAVSCRGQQITFRLAEPVSDFNEMVSIPAFGPFKPNQDKRADSVLAPFSNGPYRLQGVWDPNSGGTWVRNERWAAASDPIRRGLPDAIHYVLGIETQSAVQRVMADKGADASAVSLGPAPPALQQQITSSAELTRRTTQSRGQFIDYLAPNTTRGVFKNVRARTAFAMATSRTAYVNGLGGPLTAEAAYSLVGPALPAHTGADPFETGPSGDQAAAQVILQRAGHRLPVPIKVAYRSTPMADQAMAALAAGWRNGGFDVSLVPITDDYFRTISAPGQLAKYDAFWANWAPDWPSASTVLPPLFDSRINLSRAGTGRDYGGFADEKVNAEVTRIGTVADPAQREKAWGALDLRLTKAGVYIALAQRRVLYVAGSHVHGLRANEVAGGFLDFAQIAVG
jgi:peptide/nickel transport system substrate-binding protein